jgi:hypothetical protein
MHNRKLETAVRGFVGASGVVFGQDWHYSKLHLLHNMDAIVRPDATFIEPCVDPERVNWGSRAALLKAHQRLLGAMQERGLKPSRRTATTTSFPISRKQTCNTGLAQQILWCQVAARTGLDRSCCTRPDVPSKCGSAGELVS